MKNTTLFLAIMCLALGAFAQDDDWYRPGGFDANGCSKKLFSVSDTKKVHFSRGNLQYNAAQDKWRFALRQYQTSCGANDNAASDLNDWIDIFAWGTSGWASGATSYQPWSRSTSSAAYLPGGAGSNSLTGDYANADWGVYNRISNGGNKAGMWRTLTSEEWSYLLGNNAARSGKCGLATLQGIYKGLVILPDEWSLPNGVSFTSGYTNGYVTNNYTLNEWQRMEAAGAVFLSAAGVWDVTGETDIGALGYYWTSSYYDDNRAYQMYFADDNVSVSGQSYRYWGLSVRLVRDSRESRGLAFDEDGASYKRFSVSDTSTVRFSKGNLQYNAAKNVWRFAAKQYMYVGEGNNNIAEDYDGWIDLFSWGTSGWNSGANAYQPWSTSGNDEDYYPGGSEYNSLTGEYAKADWGVYNRIDNGGNKVGMWRTLTFDEWGYLICETYNATRSGKYGLATIRGTSRSYTGLVLLPDDWILPSGVTFTSGYGNSFATNIYTMAQWQKMEAAGALFLPAAGVRSPTSGEYLSHNGNAGGYWSSTTEGSSSGGVDIGGEVFQDHDDYRRSFGWSVRLVRD